MKKLIFSICMAIFLFPTIVLAKQIDTDEVVRKISPDMQNITLKMIKPTFTGTEPNDEFLISGYVRNLIEDPNGDFDVYAYFNSENSCNIVFTSYDNEIIGGTLQTDPYSVPSDYWEKVYTLDVTFDYPPENSMISGFFDLLKQFNMDNPYTYYIVEDLSLINYYLSSDKSSLINPGANGRALKFSTLHDITKGSNISYFLEGRAGDGGKELMFEMDFGPMSIFYNGYSYGVIDEGVYLKKVIYIPESTEDTPEAYAAAAQERVSKYLGNDSVTVTYGGSLVDLNNTIPGLEDTLLMPVVSDGNYYNVKIRDYTYVFYVKKGTEDQLKEPTYDALNIESGIEVSSTDSSIPLDTNVSVDNVEDSTIAEKIGTENYFAYNISLFSTAKGSKIEKLSNGKFLVKIPVPSILNGKSLIVYYITTDGKLEKHTAVVNGKYAEFETNHFSTYVLAEKSSEDSSVTSTEETLINNPETYDNISLYMAIAIISTLGLGLSIKKIKTN